MMNPPMNVLSTIQKSFAKFFRSSTIGERDRHWVSWSKLCLPEKEGSWGSDYCKMYPLPCFVNYGGTLGLRNQYGVST